MNTELGSLRLRRLAVPKGEPALANFSSGTGKHARVVDELVSRLYRGSGQFEPTVLVLEASNADVVGLVAYRARPLPGLEVGRDAAYVHCMGVDARYRGVQLEDGEPVGSFLLRCALHEIRKDFQGTMPAVWALIERDNRPALRVFAREGFAYVESGRSADAILFRPAGLPETT